MKKLLIWHTAYTVFLVLWCVLFFLPAGVRELGVEPGLYTLLFGVIPGLALLAISRLKEMVALKCLAGYGIFITIAAVLLAVMTPNFMWLALLWPMLGFIIEGLVAYIRFLRRPAVIAQN